MASSPQRPVDLIVIHCSASPNGAHVTSEQIDAWHQARGLHRDPAQIGFNEPKLKHIGYHYVIGVQGVCRMGRAEREIGAHVFGFNRKSIGICMVGTDRYTRSQWDTLKGLVTGVLQRHPGARVAGHRDLSPDVNGDGLVQRWEWLKTCPGFDVATWLAGGMAPLAEHTL